MYGSTSHNGESVPLVPSKSGKQHRLMEMVAHNPKAAKRLGIPQKVGRDFVAADVGKHFGTHRGRGK